MNGWKRIEIITLRSCQHASGYKKHIEDSGMLRHYLQCPNVLGYLGLGTTLKVQLVAERTDGKSLRIFTRK